MNRTKVAVVHNLPSPYRMAIFERLLEDSELDVKIFFTGKPSSNRPYWSADSQAHDSRITYLPRMSFPLRGKSADKMNLNFSIGRIFSWNPDLILLDGYTDPTNIIVAVNCWIRKLPYVLSAEISYDWTSTATGRLFNRFVAPLVKRAAFLTPSSRSCASFFVHHGGDGSRMKIIPPLPDIQRHASICQSKRVKSRETRSRLNLVNRFMVLYVGRFEDYKGIRELLAAMDEVVATDNDVSFVYVGQGSLEREVRERCERTPLNSVFVGSVEDDTLQEIFSIADIHVMPSWAEAYGIVCAEALACGVPSIVTRTSGCSDLVIDGVNGYVIEPRNPRAIAESILNAKSDPVLLKRLKETAAHSLDGQSIASLYSSLKEVISLVNLSK